MFSTFFADGDVGFCLYGLVVAPLFVLKPFITYRGLHIITSSYAHDHLQVCTISPPVMHTITSRYGYYYLPRCLYTQMLFWCVTSLCILVARSDSHIPASHISPRASHIPANLMRFSFPRLALMHDSAYWCGTYDAGEDARERVLITSTSIARLLHFYCTLYPSKRTSNATKCMLHTSNAHTN